MENKRVIIKSLKQESEREQGYRSVDTILTNSYICDIRTNLATLTHKSNLAEVYRSTHIKNTGLTLKA